METAVGAVEMAVAKSFNMREEKQKVVPIQPPTRTSYTFEHTTLSRALDARDLLLMLELALSTKEML